MVRLYLNKQWFDITNYINPQIEYNKRCDLAFGSGAFDMEIDANTFNFAAYNIPPFTLIEIDGIKYYCNSQSNRVKTRQHHYSHNVTLSSLDSILPCFIVGTKYFSESKKYGTDKRKVEILLDLMHQKYESYNFELDETADLLIQSIEHQFGAGTTLWDALVEIANYYNFRPYVKNVSGNYIYISFLNLDASTEIELDENYIISDSNTQNSEEYCKTLECEANSIVDRNHITKVNNLTCRSNEAVIKNDNCFLKLPTPAEKITKFGIVAHVKTTFKITSDYLYGYSIYTENISTSPELIYRYLLEKRSKEVADKFNELYYMLDNLVLNNKFSYIKNIGIYNMNTYTMTTTGDVIFDATNELYEKKKWDLLTKPQQAQHPYYTSGTDVIENLDAFYNKYEGLAQLFDLSSFTSFIQRITTEGQTATYSVDGFTAEQTIEGTFTSPLEVRFNIEYAAITRPYIKADKTIIESNETALTGYKQLSRSYGNTANLIDFDRFNKAIKRSVNSIGRIEKTIEYDSTYVNVDFQVPSKIKYNNIETNKMEEWYLLNYSRITTSSGTRYVLYLVKDYSTIASAISVDSQFNELKNPLDTEVERPIYVGSGWLGNGNLNKELYLKIECPSNNQRKNPSGTSTNTGYIRLAVMENDNDVILYGSSDDAFSLGNYSDKSATNYEIVASKMFAYGDIDNEGDSYSFSVVELQPDMSLLSSYQLPFYSGTTIQVGGLSFNNIKVYKDKREKLTFTIQAFI